MNRKWLIPIVAGLIGLIPWGIFAYRASVAAHNQAAQDKLCLILYGLVKTSVKQLGTKKGGQYAYYHDHPEELAQARAQGYHFLNQLPCRPPQRR